MTAGDECSAELASVSQKPSPLKQDKQKTITAITKKWERERGMPILKSQMKKKKTDVQETDNFTEILLEIIGSFKERCESKSCEQ